MKGKREESSKVRTAGERRGDGGGEGGGRYGERGVRRDRMGLYSDKNKIYN